MVASGQRLKLESDNEKKEVSIELAYAEKTDAGFYECIAENTEGRTKRKFELVVKGKAFTWLVSPRQQTICSTNYNCLTNIACFYFAFALIFIV